MSTDASVVEPQGSAVPANARTVSQEEYERVCERLADNDSVRRVVVSHGLEGAIALCRTVDGQLADLDGMAHARSLHLGQEFGSAQHLTPPQAIELFHGRRPSSSKLVGAIRAKVRNGSAKPRG